MPSGVTPARVYAIVYFALSPDTTRSNELIRLILAPPAVPQHPGDKWLRGVVHHVDCGVEVDEHVVGVAGHLVAPGVELLQVAARAEDLPSAVTATAFTSSS